MTDTTIIGSYLSPYVRKVLVTLDIKGIPFQIDPIVPYYASPQFDAISPLRRIPVLVDDCVTLADSTVICEYLEDRYPDPPMLPRAPGARAQARWLEEFADSRMGEVFIWHLYNQLVIRKFVWGQPPDQAVLTRALEQEIPQILDYLEGQVPERGFLFGSIAIADVAITTFFRNAAFARWQMDAERWPGVAGYVARLLDHDSFAHLRPLEELLLHTPIARHREALLAAGAPVARQTYGTGAPRPGILAT